MRIKTLSCIAFALVLGCEDGPQQIFQPVEPGAVPSQSGPSWTPNGLDEFGNPTAPGKGFGAGNSAGGDAAGRARFCDEEEAEAQIRAMVAAPIIPDVSVGTIPLLGENGEPYVVDTLLGRPEDGKYCDPTYAYADAFIWGPTQELVVLFNMETRLVTAVIAFQSYLGTLTGSVTVNGQPVTVTAKPRERLLIDGEPLSEYAGSADRNQNPNAFVNERNVTLLYGMVRESFFGADPLPAGFNCVESNLCRIIYTSPTQESVPQDTFVLFEDSGMQFRFSPDGHIFFIYGSPVRVAPFEVQTEVDLGSDVFAPRMNSQSVETCSLDLNAELTWADFERDCLTDARTRARISFDVHNQRDGVTAHFNASSVEFLRRTSEHGVLHDGESPGPDDVLYGLSWTLSSGAPVRQFVPATLANGYKRNLERRMRQSVAPGADEDHPFLHYKLEVPPEILALETGVPIDALRVSSGESWMHLVREDIKALYHELPTYQRDLVDDRVLTPIYLAEPYMETVLDHLTSGAVYDDGAFMAFQSTDNQVWSIGFAHFVQNGVPYRLIAQFNLSYDGVTSVSVERGYSELDTMYAGLNAFVRNNSDAPESPYFDLTLGTGEYAMNGWGLGKTGIVVNGFDRQLGTLDVTLRSITANGAVAANDFTVPGTSITDRSGFLRQLRGERYEFVPAHMVKLYGKETVMAFFVKENGEIGRISQFTFKGDVLLCRGETPEQDLTISYGVNVRKALEAWEAEVGPETYRDCELVFNYSPNGNLLDEVVSLKNKSSFWTVAERASTASIWN